MTEYSELITKKSFGKYIRVYSPPGEVTFRIFCDVNLEFPMLSIQMLQPKMMS